MRTGVYVIQHRDSGRVYIGSSVDIDKRWNDHVKSLDAGIHHSAYLQRVWKKYGSAAFDFSVALLCRREERVKAEQALIDSTPRAKLLNGTLSASAPAKDPIVAAKIAANKRAATYYSLPEHKQVLSKAGKKHWAAMSPEKRKAQVIAMHRKHSTDAFKANQSAKKKLEWATRTETERKAIMSRVRAERNEWSQQARDRVAQAVRMAWADPVKRRARIEALKAGAKRRHARASV